MTDCPRPDKHAVTDIEIVEPGVYDIPADVYHADPVKGGSLSSTGARKLIEMPPARWRYELTHPPEPTPSMILGTAVHSLVLGAGPKVVRVDADTWQGKGAKAAREQARAAGDVPLLRAEYDQAHAMAAAVQEHEIAGRLFSPQRGTPEQTLVWQDVETGVWCRAMVDHLPHPDTATRPILVDLKTTPNAGPRALGKTVANFGYHQQAAFYLDGYRTLHPGSDPAFLFVFVEKGPPYLVSVVELDQRALAVGAELNRRALAVYAECVKTGEWPGHSPEIELVSLPAWAHRTAEEVTS